MPFVLKNSKKAKLGLTSGVGDYPLAAVVTVLVVFILAWGSVLRKIGL